MDMDLKPLRVFLFDFFRNRPCTLCRFDMVFGFSNVFHMCSLFRSVAVVVVSFGFLNGFNTIYICGGWCVVVGGRVFATD